jgi:hypothetical protein
MRCERVNRPTWRGAKRAEDSTEEDILLVVEVEFFRRPEVKFETGSGLFTDASTSHLLYSRV